MRRDLAGGSSRRSDYAPLIGEALVRFIGVSADRVAEKQRELRNPIIWLREGVAAVLLWPLQLLQSLGLAPASGTAKFARSAAFQLITGFVALVGLVGSVITIVLGWRQTLEVLRHLLGR